MIAIKRKIKVYAISFILVIIVLFGIFKLISYIYYTEEYSYEFQEVKDGIYAIYYSVSSNVPSHNYDVVTICHKGQIRTLQGKISIRQTDNISHIDVIARPNMNNADEITVFIPKGTVEFAENIGLK